MEYIWTRFLDSGEEKELERKDRERMTLHHMLCQQDGTYYKAVRVTPADSHVFLLSSR
jgi:hypothetical protein